MRKSLPPLQLIGINCPNDFLGEQLEDSLKPKRILDVHSPITETVDEIFKCAVQIDNNTPFKKPLVTQEHHIRHFFTKLDAGVVAIQSFVGKELHSPLEVYAYYQNVVVPKGLGDTWLFNRFLTVISNLNPFAYTYFIVNSQSYHSQIKIKYPTFFSINVMEENAEPNTLFDFNLKAKTKTKLKQLLTEITHKSKGETHERTK